MAPQYKAGDYYVGTDGNWYAYDATNGSWVGSSPTAAQKPASKAFFKNRVVAPKGAPSSGTVRVEVLRTKPGVPTKQNSLRYPNDIKDKDTDYVLFQFGKYKPPFSGKTSVGAQLDPNRTKVSSGSKYAAYNASILGKLDSVAGMESIILYMPQDIQSETKANWQGKSFSNLGREGLKLAGGNFSGPGNEYNLGQGMNNAIKALITGAINQVPGVGGNLTLNDTLGVTEGVMLNPNVEVLFDSPELREFTLKFKMTPHDDTEAKTIKQICNTFRKASVPYFDRGATRNYQATGLSGGNVIGVPLVCNVSFMTGSEYNQFVPQYKQTVIQSVQINYTPDGAYATYSGGSPVATELTVKFLETKLIFAEEINTAGEGATL